MRVAFHQAQRMFHVNSVPRGAATLPPQHCFHNPLQFVLHRLQTGDPSFDLPELRLRHRICRLTRRRGPSFHYLVAELLVVVVHPLEHVVGHVHQDATDVVVGGRVEHLPTLALRTHDSGRTKQAQVVADQADAHLQSIRDPSHRQRAGRAQQGNAQPTGVTEQPEQIGENTRLITAQRTDPGEIFRCPFMLWHFDD